MENKFTCNYLYIDFNLYKYFFSYDLNYTEFSILMYIHKYTSRYKNSYLSNTHFKIAFNISIRQVQRILQKLEQFEYIIIEYNKNDNYRYLNTSFKFANFLQTYCKYRKFLSDLKNTDEYNTCDVRNIIDSLKKKWPKKK